MASLLGTRAAAAADQRDTGGPNADVADERLDELLNGLEDAEFLTVERTEGEETIPGGSLFVVVGGTEEPPYEMGPMASELARDLAEGGPVLAAETSDSQAEILVSIIDDGGRRADNHGRGGRHDHRSCRRECSRWILLPRGSSVTTASGRPRPTRSLRSRVSDRMTSEDADVRDTSGQAGSLGRGAAMISMATAVSRVTGFLRVMAVAAAMGTTFLANTYQTANTAPNLVFELIAAGVLTSVFVPTFVDYLVKGRREEGWNAANAMTTVALAGLTAIAILVALFAPLIMRLFFIGIEDDVLRGESVALGTTFLRLFAPQIILYGAGHDHDGCPAREPSLHHAGHRADLQQRHSHRGLRHLHVHARRHRARSGRGLHRERYGCWVPARPWASSR